MNDFPQVASFVKPLYKTNVDNKDKQLTSETKVEHKKQLNLQDLQLRKFSKTNHNQKGKLKIFVKSNSITPIVTNEVFIEGVNNLKKIHLFSPGGYKWFTYLVNEQKMMENDFQKDKFCRNTELNLESSLPPNLNSGDGKVVSYIEYPLTKSLDHIDNAEFMHHGENKEPAQTELRSNRPSDKTFWETDRTPPVVINSTHLLTNNNNNFINSPLKPPRHVKLKKNRTRHLSCDLNINNFNNYESLSNNQFQHQRPVPLNEYNLADEILQSNSIRNHKNKLVSIGIQASPLPPYRLRVLPKCPQAQITKRTDDILPTAEDIIKYDPSPGCCLCIRTRSCGQCVGRVFMSQCGLGVALFAWALLGAAAFHYTEGPFELFQIAHLKTVQNDLVVGLATDLRKADLLQPVWRETIEKYFAKHETMLLEAVSTGYGEGGGNQGQIWSYPGCILFTISLLTTLGFGAPVPRTALGRTTAVIFSAIGIPLHFLLVLNVGMVLARRLQRWSSSYPPYSLETTLNERKYKSFDISASLPKWLNWFPVAAGVLYYIIGVLLFGLLRQRYFESFLFPLDFTATGGVALTPGYMRIGYGLYLEGAVMLGGIAVSLLQNSATGKMTDIGLKLGLLTNS